MSNIDEMCGYFKKLEANMELREEHINEGKFSCGNDVTYEWTEEDKQACGEKVKSFKEKANKIIKAFNTEFNTRIPLYKTISDIEPEPITE